eukprot:TRINITY_DN1329_c1_g1_i1.p1 TRINITY_DN1329_c1_g1~~TRINITY_DN1329_c1_g1_i1.p1  ORF type:complete len:296 (-),score=78.87 TRINITY_DN1329_c1_g1_i1:69-956(-)
MATRDLTKLYDEIRATQRRSSFSRANSAPSHSHIDLAVIAAPPVWAEVCEAINLDIHNISQRLDQLAKLHNERLKVTFGNDEDSQDHKIDVVTKEITALLRRCENNLKRIATQGTENGLSPEEQSMRLNAMKGMAVKVRAQSQRFRAAQKDFLMKMKKREDFPIDIGDEPNEDGSIPLDEIMEKGFTPQQMAEIEQLRRQGRERETQIIQIAQSINELAQMFKELSVLIVEQGSIVDRIDYNINQAKSHVESGLKEVRETKKIQDGQTGRSWICMAILFVAIVICISILVAKLKK